MNPSVLLYVQHLLGIGHLARASLIADALGRAGSRVTLVLGGPPVAGLPTPAVETVALPPVKAGQGGFGELADLAGQPVSQGYLARRREQLLGVFDERHPEIVLIEAFPFGRRQMRFELEPLLERAKCAPWRPLIACSLRDILQEGRKAGRDRETVEVLKDCFDIVLVHGDPELITLDATFPLAGEIAPLVRYTGIVTGPVGALDGPGFDVVVSAGGGAAGSRLMRAACGALQASQLNDARWGFITGPNLPPQTAVDLADRLPASAVMVAHRADFRAILANTRLSISQAGYNTAADVLKAGCRSVMVPFAEGGETEQSRRAAALSALGLVHVVDESVLSPETLANAVERAMSSGPPPATGLKLDGAEATVKLLLAACHAKRRR